MKFIIIQLDYRNIHCPSNTASRLPNKLLKCWQQLTAFLACIYLARVSFKTNKSSRKSRALFILLMSGKALWLFVNLAWNLSLFRITWWFFDFEWYIRTRTCWITRQTLIYTRQWKLTLQINVSREAYDRYDDIVKPRNILKAITLTNLLHPLVWLSEFVTIFAPHIW